MDNKYLGIIDNSSEVVSRLTVINSLLDSDEFAKFSPDDVLTCRDIVCHVIRECISMLSVEEGNCDE